MEPSGYSGLEYVPLFNILEQVNQNGEGTLNEDGIAYYDQLKQDMFAKNIELMIFVLYGYLVSAAVHKTENNDMIPYEKRCNGRHIIPIQGLVVCSTALKVFISSPKEMGDKIAVAERDVQRHMSHDLHRSKLQDKKRDLSLHS